jgi:hypothetical protein
LQLSEGEFYMFQKTKSVALFAGLVVFLAIQVFTSTTPASSTTVNPIPSYQAGASGAMKYVSQFDGADIGARINAADASCGARPCTIYVDLQGSIATHVVLHSYHTLWFGLGDWTCATVNKALNNDTPFDLESFTTVRGSGWGTRIAEPTVPGLLYVFYLTNNRVLGSVNKHVTISDLQIIGASGENSGAMSTIHLGNCLHCSIHNVLLNDTGAIGVAVGNSSLPGAPVNIINASNTSPIVITTAAPHRYETGEETTIASVRGNTAANGKFIVTVTDATHFTIGVAGNGSYISGGTAQRNAHAIDVTVSECSFFKVATQNLALVNGKDIHFINNKFRASGDTLSNGSSLDLEPNSPSDWISEFEISGNIFDASQSHFFTVAIQIYDTQESGIVSHNIIKGGPFARGVSCERCNNVVIEGNQISNVTQPAITIAPCTGCSVINNDIRNAGSASNEAIVVGGPTTNSNISSNRIYPIFGGNSSVISAYRSVGNTYLDNLGVTYSNTTTTSLIRDNNGVAFANLPPAKDGSEIYCSNCRKTTPCMGGGTGAMAKYLNGARDCN